MKKFAKPVSLPEANRYFLVLSPDGTRAVVLSIISVARPAHLTVFDLDFEHVAEFTDEDSRDIDFEWSADGARLFIAAEKQGMLEKLHVMDTSDEGFLETRYRSVTLIDTMRQHGLRTSTLSRAARSSI